MPEVAPALHVDAPTGTARAVVLVLHGGRSRSHMRARAGQLAVLRMQPFVTSLRRAGRSHGLVVARVRYRYRGWNGDEQSPVPDVRWALRQLDERFGALPSALVGHSMGGRAAMYAAGHPSVTTVVGLAPWIEPGDPVTPLAGRALLVAHGTGDRMTSNVESARFTREAAAVTRSASYVAVDNDAHAMLRRAPVWHQLSTGFVLAGLLGTDPDGTVPEPIAKIVSRALAGDARLEV
ncbi:alpha/beta hydrolase [uncultured Jatrophihabitans sp.]|uniref:alpha/beta hydrolase n=1 Tax=uncultured Jatrophihabitans sp. TaxID=1610747 RepID=UPI0035C9BB24